MGTVRVCLLLRPLLQMLQAEAQQLQAERARLESIGDAFDLPVVHCPQLGQVADRLMVLGPVYDLYTQTKVRTSILREKYDRISSLSSIRNVRSSEKVSRP